MTKLEGWDLTEHLSDELDKEFPTLDSYELWDTLDDLKTVAELPLPELKVILERDATVREEWEAFKQQAKPRRRDFHDKLAESAGIAPDEQEELLDLIEQRLRLKRGDR